MQQNVENQVDVSHTIEHIIMIHDSVDAPTICINS